MVFLPGPLRYVPETTSASRTKKIRSFLHGRVSDGSVVGPRRLDTSGPEGLFQVVDQTHFPVCESWGWKTGPRSMLFFE